MTRMRVGLFFLLSQLSAFCICVVNAEQFPNHQLGDTADVFFLNGQQGWISKSDLQLIYKTSDGGETWASHPSPAGLFRIMFIDPKVGWGLGGTQERNSKSGIGVFKTNDGGQTWGLVNLIDDFDPSAGGYLNNIFFINSDTGFVLGAQKGGLSIVLVTRDGGRTFSRIESLSGIFQSARGIFGDKTGTTWICGNENMAVSRDQGHTWRVVKPEKWNGGSVIEAGQFVDGLHGFAVGMRIFSTSNGGTRWEEIADSSEGQPFGAIHFWDKERGCAASNTTLLFCTNDGGKSWTKRRVLPLSKNPQQPDGNIFFRIFFTAGGRNGWVLDYEGNLYKTSDLGNSWQPFRLEKSK